jgi:type IV secretion system protein VirB8
VLRTDREAVITGALWTYVQAREGYSWQDARRNYETVSAMSAPTPRDAYQHFFLPNNKESPQLVIGKHGQVNVQFAGISFESGAPIAYLRFWRIVAMDGQIEHRTLWTATIGYRVNVAMPGRTRLIDPEGIEVTSYAARQDTPGG